MRDPSFYVNGLLDLGRQTDLGERRASWRQSIAALARDSGEDGPRPLEGLSPDALLKGVRAALDARLVDDLDFLEEAAGAGALYELASALPLGPEQRELGRRVLSRLLSGKAATFALLATRMALASGKGLSTPAVRARVALVTELPLTQAVADGPLALALASRRELAREWIAVNSTGSLPARRLAARLLERAAREAATRASLGDTYVLRAFRSDAVAEAWQRLIADRESLVWRHVAAARGLLAPWVESFAAGIEGGLAPDLSPTEWRRAATSIAAEIAVDPEKAMATALHALAQGLLDRDPGAASSFVWGLPRATEAEPEAATELIDGLAARSPAQIAEAVAELRAELGAGPMFEHAASAVLRALNRRSIGDDGADALSREIARDLGREPRDDHPLREQVLLALERFASDGAQAAYAAGREILAAAKGAIDALDAVTVEDEAADGRSGSLARRTSLVVLRDLDLSFLERAVVADLLKLGGPSEQRAHDEALDAARSRLADWILVREGKPLDEAAAATAHVTLALRRLRALLHLVDIDLASPGDDSAHAAEVRGRWLHVARALVERFEGDAPSSLRRATLATLARVCDALVRLGVLDVCDVLLLLARTDEDASEFETLAEASMAPDLIQTLSRYASFASACADAPPDVHPAAGRAFEPRPSASHAATLKALGELTRDLVPDLAGRLGALRSVLVRLHAALEAIAGAGALRDLCTPGSTEPDAVTSLETALGALSQLTIGAHGRVDPERVPTTAFTYARPLGVAVSRVLTGAEPALREKDVSVCLDEMLVAVPRAIARVVASIVWDLARLPVEPEASAASRMKRPAEAIPQWIPARRTLGGFYVVRSLGSGAGGSVFVVTRVEDRQDPDAEQFALKVPEYSATAARSVTEAEFMKMFRDEAGALISVPAHPSLARFVTLDLGAKPKPILVMELVEGISLERAIESRALDGVRALKVLDDVLAGLEAMHSVGVAHLDLKPANVLLRDGREGVLVDFGLAGRHIRPGCATGPYGAPEVWGAMEEGMHPVASAADVYAFGCVAFETLTAQVLFEAPTEMAQIAAHVAHDGFPPALRSFSQHPALAALSELLFSALRRDPQKRPTARALRDGLRRVAPGIAGLKWPLGV